MGLPSWVFVLSAWREVAEVLLEFGRHLDGISLSCAWQVGEGVSCWVYWVGVLLAWGACRVLGVECWGLGFRVYGFRVLDGGAAWLVCLGQWQVRRRGGCYTLEALLGPLPASGR